MMINKEDVELLDLICKACPPIPKEWITNIDNMIKQTKQNLLDHEHFQTALINKMAVYLVGMTKDSAEGFDYCRTPEEVIEYLSEKVREEQANETKQ